MGVGLSGREQDHRSAGGIILSQETPMDVRRSISKLVLGEDFANDIWAPRAAACSTMGRGHMTTCDHAKSVLRQAILFGWSGNVYWDSSLTCVSKTQRKGPCSPTEPPVWLVLQGRGFAKVLLFIRVGAIFLQPRFRSACGNVYRT